MNRQRIVTAAVVVLLAAAILFLIRGGGSRPGESGGVPSIADRVFSSDSLGVRLQLPDSPAWTVQREAVPRSDGRVISAIHQDSTATVHLFALPAAADASVAGVFEARKKVIASLFGLDNLDKVIRKTLRDSTSDAGGRTMRQWQAVSHPVEIPGEKPVAIVFMWVGTENPKHSIECIGLLRFHPDAGPDQQQRSDAHLRELAAVFQSLVLR